MAPLVLTVHYYDIYKDPKCTRLRIIRSSLNSFNQNENDSSKYSGTYMDFTNTFHYSSVNNLDIDVLFILTNKNYMDLYLIVEIL